MSDRCPAVAEVAAALAALPVEVQGYEVWCESDPSDSVRRPEDWWIEHEARRVHL